jgi:hypothetical protein
MRRSAYLCRLLAAPVLMNVVGEPTQLLVGRLVGGGIPLAWYGCSEQGPAMGHEQAIASTLRENEV